VSGAVNPQKTEWGLITDFMYHRSEQMLQMFIFKLKNITYDTKETPSKCRLHVNYYWVSKFLRMKILSTTTTEFPLEI
jgi:hypothetical protein